MITEICANIRNWFSGASDRHLGTFSVSGGTIAPLDFIKPGQYFRVLGSTFNDGVYKYPASGMVDETFDGSIWAMKVPPDFIALVSEIEAYMKTPAAQPSAFDSESFAGYSYHRKADNDGGDGSAWQAVFQKRLNQWRKM